MSEDNVSQANDNKNEPGASDVGDRDSAADADRVIDETIVEVSNAQCDDTQMEQDRREAVARALRAQAELENFRKRVRREMEEERKYSQMPLLRDLLPVLDNFDRALEALKPADADAGLLQGVSMVSQQLKDVLQQHQCQRISDIGQPFDPEVHEAIAQQPSDEYASGTVLHVAQTGYRLHDRVIRAAQVIVSTGPDTSESTDSARGTET